MHNSLQGKNLTLRRGLDLKEEIALAIAPTVIVLLVMAFVETLTQQRLLFASPASPASPASLSSPDS